MFHYLLWFREVDSTQDILKNSDLPAGTVVVADVQKKGKGRKGRRWESQRGGLYFSFVVSSKEFKEFLQLPLVVGYALSEAVDNFKLRTYIKWPNDIYLSGKKLAGILCEKSGDRIVVGIGLNLNQDSFPDSVKDRAISLKLATRRAYNPVSTLTSLLNCLNGYLELYRKEGFTPFLKPIESKLLFLGEEVIVLSEERIEGRLVGISNKGFLILKTPRGYRSLVSGEVSLRPKKV